MATLFESCSAIMYAGTFLGDNSQKGTSFSFLPTSGIGDFDYTGSTGITGSSRINSTLNFQEFTINATPKIDYSYTNENFAFISGGNVANRTISSSILQGSSTGNLILEGETNNHFITPITFTTANVNVASSSLDKFITEGNYDYNIVTFQEDTASGEQARLDFQFNAFSDDIERIVKISYCVSGGFPFNSVTADKARILKIQGQAFDQFSNLVGTGEDILINPSEYTNAKLDPDSASIFVRSGFNNLEVTDIGDGWLRLAHLSRMSGSVGTNDVLRVRYVTQTGNPDGGLNTGNNSPGSGSSGAPNGSFTSSIATFSIANLQLEVIEDSITGSLSGSADSVKNRNALAFMPATSYIPTSASAITKPSESLELPLTSSTIDNFLTDPNQGTIITRFAWTPLSGSDEASSNHFALLKTGSAPSSDYLRIDGRGIYYRSSSAIFSPLSTNQSQIPYLTQSGSLTPTTYHNYAFTWSGSEISCSIDSGSIITAKGPWTGSSGEQLEYITGITNISHNTQVRVQYIMVSPHKFSADALKNSTNTTIV